MDCVVDPYAIRAVLVRVFRGVVPLDRSRSVSLEFVDCQAQRRFPDPFERRTDLLYHDGGRGHRHVANHAC